MLPTQKNEFTKADNMNKLDTVLMLTYLMSSKYKIQLLTCNDTPVLSGQPGAL